MTHVKKEVLKMVPIDDKRKRELIRNTALKQVEFYLSDDNLKGDIYLMSKMDPENYYVDIQEILNFPRMGNYNLSLEETKEIISKSLMLELDPTGNKVRPKFNLKIHKIIILKPLGDEISSQELTKILSGFKELLHVQTIRKIKTFDKILQWIICLFDINGARNLYKSLTSTRLPHTNELITATLIENYVPFSDLFYMDSFSKLIRKAKEIVLCGPKSQYLVNTERSIFNEPKLDIFESKENFLLSDYVCEEANDNISEEKSQNTVINLQKEELMDEKKTSSFRRSQIDQDNRPNNYIQKNSYSYGKARNNTYSQNFSRESRNIRLTNQNHERRSFEKQSNIDNNYNERRNFEKQSNNENNYKERRNFEKQSNNESNYNERKNIKKQSNNDNNYNEKKPHEKNIKKIEKPHKIYNNENKKKQSFPTIKGQVDRNMENLKKKKSEDNYNAANLNRTKIRPIEENRKDNSNLQEGTPKN